MIRYLLSLCLVALLMLGSVSTQGAVTPTTELYQDLASETAWTFQSDLKDALPFPVPVPKGGWRLNGYPDVTSGTYRRKITIPVLPGSGATGQVTEVAFEAVNWEAVISIGPDAEHLQEVTRHLSPWTPFRADISRYVTPGKSYLLQVHVRDRNHFVNTDGLFTVPAGAP